MNRIVKKTVIGVLAAGLVLGVGVASASAAAYVRGRNFADANGDGVCDRVTRATRCGDADGDGLCDVCGLALAECASPCGSTCKLFGDADGDGVCDGTGGAGVRCGDADGDGLCEVCGAAVGDCATPCGVACKAGTANGNGANANGNGNGANTAAPRCGDTDGDGLCDVCGAAIGDCATPCGAACKAGTANGNGANANGNNGNGNGAYTAAPRCGDADGDGLCDVCGRDVADCASPCGSACGYVDADADGVCDHRATMQTSGTHGGCHGRQETSRCGANKR